MDTKYFKTPFAASGDKNVVPDAAPPDGSVSYASGFGPDYQLDPATDPSALDILRPDHNGILHDVTDSVRALQEFFAPQWISAADNGGVAFPYAAKALVLYTDGQVWQSLVADNTATPGTDATKWIVFQSNNATVAALNAEVARAEAAEAAILAAIPPGAMPGAIWLWSSTAPPAGWLECNGAQLVRADYPALSAVLIANFAHNDIYFNLPDLRGYFPRGWNHGAPGNPDPLRAFGSQQAESFASHTHVVKYSSDNSGDVGPGHGGNNSESINTQATGGGETRPVNIALMFIIKT